MTARTMTAITVTTTKASTPRPDVCACAFEITDTYLWYVWEDFEHREERNSDFSNQHKTSFPLINIISPLNYAARTMGAGLQSSCSNSG